MKRDITSIVLIVVFAAVFTLAACAPRHKSKAAKTDPAKQEMQQESTAAKAESEVKTGATTTPSPLNVADAAIAKSVANLTPVDSGSSFDDGVGTLYCFTKVLGAAEPTQITHVWYYNNEQVAMVNLDVKSSAYRTYSSKNIWPGATGNWRVEVKDQGGALLNQLNFEVKAATP